MLSLERGGFTLNAQEIIAFLEKPSKDTLRRLYRIRDEVEVSKIVAALHVTSLPSTHYLLYRLLDFRVRAEFFVGKRVETRIARPALLDALSSDDENVRFVAEDVLGTLDVIEQRMYEREHTSAQQESIAALIAQLKNGDARQAAATALGDIVDARVLPPLLAALRDEQHDVRREAALALAGLAEDAHLAWFDAAHRDAVLPPLLQALQDEESSVREAVAEAVEAWYEDSDPRVVEPLLGLIHDTDRKVRRQVVEALSYLKDERTLEPLLHVFFTDEDEEIRCFAAQGLGKFADARAVNSLIHALQDQDTHQRLYAGLMLCWLRDERATDALLIALRDPNREVRVWAIEALWELCTERRDDLSEETSTKIHAPVTQALQDEDSEVRERASDILEWLA